MNEVQKHGFVFERWVQRIAFANYQGPYGQEWDIPATANCQGIVPSNFRGLPVSVKVAKIGSPIGLGDILRQISISEEFIMIGGFWEQRNPNEKYITKIGVARFSPAIWRDLWGAVDSNKLHLIDSHIKNLGLHYTQARNDVKEWKRKYFIPNGSRIVMNPKIDSKIQRRIQCSLPCADFWRIVGEEPSPSDAPTLFGQSFSNPIVSNPRVFNQD